MKTNIYSAALVLMCCCNAVRLSAGLIGTAPASLPQSHNHPQITPFAFIENKGQVLGFDQRPHPEVKFLFNLGNTQLFLLEKGIAYQFSKIHTTNAADVVTVGGLPYGGRHKALPDVAVRTETFRMDMELADATTAGQITTEGRSSDHINYYSSHALDVHNFTRVVYHNVYPGIDWVVYAQGHKVKYDFVVQPGADPSLIQLKFNHQEQLFINEEDGLTVANRLGSLTEQEPQSYQGSHPVASRFVLKGNVVSFALGTYDHSQPLVIDPALTWSTYYGDAGVDNGYACATDASGNVYLAGTTQSAAYIAAGGYQNTIGGGADAFLVKFNSAGVRLWASYYGGAAHDLGYGCAVDASGNAYLAGTTASSSDIASQGHQNVIGGSGSTSDAFLAKFDSNGSRLWATYYGGSGNDYGYSCCTDAAGNVYLCGKAGSASAIASGGHQNSIGGIFDAFLVKFDGNGTRLWGTYYGDTGTESGASCATDAFGNVYLAGDTDSPNNIAYGGHDNSLSSYADAFLVKFNGAGTRQWATYYGGAGLDLGLSCSTDNSANVYLSGNTESTSSIASGGFSTVFGGGFSDAFLVKFNSAGTRLWGTYYGGQGNDNGYACFTDNSGNVYLGGQTGSAAAIATSGYQTQFGGGADGFLASFDSNGMRQWGTYFGGPSLDVVLSGTCDNAGNVFIAGYTKSGYNIATGGHQSTLGGNNDAFLARFCGGISPSQPLAINGNTLFCAGTPQVFSVGNDPNATGYTWFFPSGASANGTNTVSMIPDVSGVISVAASGSCGVTALQSLTLNVYPQPQLTASSGAICAGQSFSINTFGAFTYTITGGSYFVSPAVTTSYSITGTSQEGCAAQYPAIATVSVSQCTGVDEFAGQNDNTELFPNPSTGSFQLRSTTAVRLSLYNETGECIWHSNNPAAQTTIAVQGLSKGIYLAHIVSAHGIEVKKIVVLAD